jgi:hypothetical protein
MRWQRNWSERSPRPKVRRLSTDGQLQLLAKMTTEIARSSVLAGFGVQVRLLRGRFYVERSLPSGVEVWGRIVPLADELLLPPHAMHRGVRQGSDKSVCPLHRREPAGIIRRHLSVCAARWIVGSMPD